MNDASVRYDTVIIGSGFAGLVAARDLAAAGQRVLVLEGRDRIGGRTWYEDRLGLGVELGGTWVHWTQPYVWRELNFYGIETVKSPDFERAIWFEGDARRSGSLDELLDAMAPGCEAFGADTRAVFPRAFEPFTNDKARALDGLTVDDRIDQLDLTPEQRELLRVFWSLNFNGHTDRAAYTQALRWLAATNGDWQVMWEACASYKVSGGTKALADAIYEDALSNGAEFRFEERVLSIEEAPDAVSVRTDAGEYSGDRTIVTVPLEVLGRIGFVPEPSLPIQTAIERGQVGRGTKIWFKLKGDSEPFMALGKAEWPLHFLQGEYPQEDGIVVIGFGSDSEAIDPTNAEEITAAVRRFIPDAELESFTAHDWVADELAGETWPMHAPGYFSESLPSFLNGSERIRFAGADYAVGWGGFIDGAIESATQQSRRILNETSAA